MYEIKDFIDTMVYGFEKKKIIKLIYIFKCNETLENIY